MDTVRAKLRELFGIDERALAVMRIGCALVILLDLASRARFLVAHYTQDGVLPRELLLQGDYVSLSLHFLNDSALYQGLLFLLTAGFATILLLGWKTRLATIATLILLVSLHLRNPLVVFHGDMELRLLLFFAMFLPWGRRYSLEARKHTSTTPTDHLVVSGASAALLLQVAFIYLFAATEKFGYAWREDGSAIFLALSNAHFGSPLGQLLLTYPDVLTLLTFGVLWLQQLSFLLLFFPIRTYLVRGVAVSLLLLMQLGFGFTLILSFFPLVSILALLAFIPPRWWAALERKLLTRL